jgi:hypothetical protein
VNEFDQRVEAHVDRLKQDHKKRLAKQASKDSGNKRLRATTIDHDLNYGVTIPMFLGEMRIGED